MWKIIILLILFIFTIHFFIVLSDNFIPFLIAKI